jgi:glycine/D-amino acid oxidase-like deaminating enzyme
MELALGEYRKLCAGNDFGFETKDNYIYATDSDKPLQQEMAALEKLGIPVEWADAKLPFLVAGAIRFLDQAQFDPLKLVSSIAGGLRIFEHTAARQFAPGQVMTDRGTIRAEKIIVTTHFPILNKHGGYFLKM